MLAAMRALLYNNKCIINTRRFFMSDNETANYSYQNQPIQQKQLISFGTAFLFAFSLLFFGPVDIYLTNITDITVSSRNIIFPAAVISLAVLTGLFLLLYKLKGKAHIIAVNIVTGLSLALYVQGNFLQLSSAELDGRRLSVSAVSCAVNALIWGVCISVPFLLYKFFGELYAKAVKFLALIICVMELTALLVTVTMLTVNDGTGILTDALANEIKPYTHSQENEFVFSSDHNLIVIFADEYDSFCFDSSLEEAPESAAALKDFTYYKDTVGMYGASIPALKHIFSGTLYTEDGYPTDLFDTIASNGFDMEFYVTNGDVVPLNISEKYADNFVENKSSFSDILCLTDCIYKIVGYKYSPVMLKPLFYMTSSEISQKIYANKAYYPDVLTFYNTIPETGTLSENKLFKLYFTLGLHDPRNITRDLKRAPDWSISGEEQAIAVNKVLSAFIEMLKNTGAYDNSDIVILADHGLKTFEGGAYPLLMIKRAGEKHDELNVSTLKVSYEQIFPTLIELAGGESEDKTVFELTPEDNETRSFDHAPVFVTGHTKGITD